MGTSKELSHDDVIKWKLFPRYWLFVREKASVIGGLPSQRQMTWSFDGFPDLRLNKRLSKQSRRRWFETLPRLLWRHCNGYDRFYVLAMVDLCKSSQRIFVSCNIVWLQSMFYKSYVFYIIILFVIHETFYSHCIKLCHLKIFEVDLIHNILICHKIRRMIMNLMLRLCLHVA